MRHEGIQLRNRSLVLPEASQLAACASPLDPLDRQARLASATRSVQEPRGHLVPAVVYPGVELRQERGSALITPWHQSMRGAQQPRERLGVPRERLHAIGEHVVELIDQGSLHMMPQEPQQALACGRSSMR